MCKPSDPRRLHLADQSNASERHLIIMPTFVDVPEIKLIRTDTTLDLSQKAEKVCFRLVSEPHLKPPGRPRRLWMAQGAQNGKICKRGKGVHRSEDVGNLL